MLGFKQYLLERRRATPQIRAWLGTRAKPYQYWMSPQFTLPFPLSKGMMKRMQNVNENTLAFFGYKFSWQSRKVTEVRSETFGLCYTLSSLHPVSAHNLSGINLIQLTKSRNLKVFIHGPGDEFWIIRSVFPVHTDVITIEG